MTSYLDKVEIYLDKVEIYLDKVEIQPWIVTHSCSIATLGFGAPKALTRRNEPHKYKYSTSSNGTS